MPLGQLAALSAVRGAAETLGVSASGAEIALRVAIDPGLAPPGATIDAAIAFGAALAVALAVRRRLAAMFVEGIRSLARPELVRDVAASRAAARFAAALGASVVAHFATRGVFAPWQASPLAAGFGLVATGAALASLAVAGPRPVRGLDRRGSAAADAPSLGAALLAGVAHGAAGCPGASRLSAALVVLVWFGMRPPRAAEFALGLTCVSSLAAATTSAFGGAGERVEFVAVLAAFLAAFAAALAGAAALRALAVRRRIAVLAGYVLPLGAALLAYARALPLA
jgi:undecaprenyl-diphosphatase